MRAAVVVALALLAATLAAAGCTTTNVPTRTTTSFTPNPARVVHWHAKYQVWVNDQQLDFSDPGLDGRSVNYHGQLYLPAHLHSPSDIIHNEGIQGEGTMAHFFLYDLGGKLTTSEMVVPDVVLGPHGDFQVDAAHGLAMAVAPLNGTWASVPDFPNASFHDGDRILLVYGDTSAERMAELEAQFPAFDPRTVR